MTLEAIVAIPRPIPIVAVRFEGGWDSYNEVSAWIESQEKVADDPKNSSGFSIWYGGFGQGGRFILLSPEGELEVAPGDWVVRGIKNQFRPVKHKDLRSEYVQQYNFTGRSALADDRIEYIQ